MIIDFKIANARIERRQNIAVLRKGAPGGFSREGGASRSESNESIAGGNRTTNTSALVREQTAVSAPLRLLLIDFLAEARKPPPEAPSLWADRGVVRNLKNETLALKDCSGKVYSALIYK